jgi:hypothetical protein
MRWRFTDKVLAFVPWRAIVTLKAGSLEEYSLLERWGVPAEAPSALVLEACIQSGRWLVEASSAFSQTIEPLEIPCWRVMEGLRPGERLRVSLRVEERSEERIRFKVWQERLLPGQAETCAGGVSSESPMSTACDLPHTAEPDLLFTAALMPLEERSLPLDRECLWQELSA